jgi:hypothetical protein
MQNKNEPTGFNPARPKDLGPDYGRSGYPGASTQKSADPGASSAQNLGDQAMAAGRDMAERARDVASSTADALKTQAADLASEGRDKLMEKAQEQKRAGADYLAGVAEAIRRAAGEFEKEVPFAGGYIRTAAAEVDHVADTVRDGDFSKLMTQTQDFARRQPTLFVGLSMLAGFGVARLLKGAAAPAMAASAAASGSGLSGRSGATDGSRTLGRGAGVAGQATGRAGDPGERPGM